MSSAEKSSPEAQATGLNAAAMVEVLLQPGEYFVGDRSHIVRTLLGSCVSITLWHPRLRVGAMCHYMLAERNGTVRNAPLNARYGDDALTLMIEQLTAMGAPVAKCQAKIFGGGDMFVGQQRSATIGRKNGDAARALLAQRGIAVTAASMFGIGHRNIIFNVNTGDVWSRQVDPSQLARANNQELPCPTSR
jgi:chemotaxis protein CheD